MRGNPKIPTTTLALLLFIILYSAGLGAHRTVTIQQSQLAQAALSVPCNKGDPNLNDQCKSAKYISYQCLYPEERGEGVTLVLCYKNAPCGGVTYGGRIVKGYCDAALCCRADTVDGQSLGGLPPDNLQFSDKPVFNETTGMWEGQNTPTAGIVAPEDESAPLRQTLPPGLLGPGTVYSDSGDLVSPDIRSPSQYPMQAYEFPPSFKNYLDSGGNPNSLAPVPPEYSLWTQQKDSVEQLAPPVPTPSQAPSLTGNQTLGEPLMRPPLSDLLNQSPANSTFSETPSNLPPSQQPSGNWFTNWVRSWAPWL